MLAFPLMQPGAAASHLPAGAAAALALAQSNSSAMQLPRIDHAIRQLEPITAAILLLLAVGGAFVTTEAVVDALHDKSKCMKEGLHDPYCCAPPGEGGCASGFEHSFVDGGVCKIDKAVCEGCQATICVPRLAHLDGEDCWRHCKSSNWTSGPCLWCGSQGACCREGYPSPECPEHTGNIHQHVCMPAVTTPPPMPEAGAGSVSGVLLAWVLLTATALAAWPVCCSRRSTLKRCWRKLDSCLESWAGSAASAFRSLAVPERALERYSEMDGEEADGGGAGGERRRRPRGWDPDELTELEMGGLPSADGGGRVVRVSSIGGGEKPEAAMLTDVLLAAAEACAELAKRIDGEASREGGGASGQPSAGDDDDTATAATAAEEVENEPAPAWLEEAAADVGISKRAPPALYVTAEAQQLEQAACELRAACEADGALPLSSCASWLGRVGEARNHARAALRAVREAESGAEIHQPAGSSRPERGTLLAAAAALVERIQLLATYGHRLDGLLVKQREYVSRLSALQDRHQRGFVDALVRLLAREGGRVLPECCPGCCPGVIPPEQRRLLEDWTARMCDLCLLHRSLATEWGNYGGGFNATRLCEVLERKLAFVEVTHRALLASHHKVEAALLDLNEWHPSVEEMISTLEHDRRLARGAHCTGGERNAIEPSVHDMSMSLSAVLADAPRHLMEIDLQLREIANAMPPSHAAAPRLGRLVEAVRAVNARLDEECAASRGDAALL